jgi:hypothetical protein
MTDQQSRPFRNPIAERADALVRAMGLGKLAEPRTREPHVLRWWPLLVLAATAGGYALIVLFDRSGFDRPLAMLSGYAMVYGGFSAAIWLRIFGPRMISTIDSPLDEREQLIKFRAHHLSGKVLVGLAFLGCYYFALAQPFALWMPRTNEWIALAFLIQTWAITLPILIASWLQPRLDADD